nr:MAG TPA: hypothetical protein [Caudoviricetes sp.]
MSALKAFLLFYFSPRYVTIAIRFLRKYERKRECIAK